jgi:hypothetical protein
MNWNEAEELMKTARNKKKGKPIGNNTRLYFTTAEEIKGTRGWNHNLTYSFEKSKTDAFPYYTIRLHGNRIIDIYEDRILPSDGGWQSVTTKARLNEYLPRGFRVFQKNWEWYLEDTYANTSFPFGDVYYISTKDIVSFVNGEWSSKVMLYSTHPKYPEVYGNALFGMLDDEEEGEDE